MDIIEIKNSISNKLSERDYYGMFQIIDSSCEQYLSEKKINYSTTIELINQCQDLYEFLGSSKQFEMAFDLHNKLISHRNRLFISSLTGNQNELKGIYKRIVGDYSTD